MEQLVIDISDKIEALGILFANLMEGFPLNELPQSELNIITYEQQDPIISSAENSLYLSAAINHVPGDAQSGEHRETICPQTESPSIWMGCNAHPDNGWRPGPVWHQHCTPGRFQIAGGRRGAFKIVALKKG